MNGAPRSETLLREAKQSLRLGFSGSWGESGARTRAVVLAVALAACGHKPPQGSWIEREGHGVGQTHATSDGGGGAVVTGGALSIDPSKIDEADEGTVLAALERAGDAAPAARLALRAARLAYHRGDESEARALLARAATAADEREVHDELAAIAAQIAAPPVQPGVVAVLLPLSGRFALIGSELRSAIQLAPAPGTTWKFIDTRGEPEGAEQGVDAAIAAGAVAILGPVGQKEALAAARRASLRQIPIALLAPSDGADPAAGVFRLVDSPADEGRAVAKLAVTEGFPTVAVFAPRDDLGAESAEAFVAEAQRLGLSVQGQGTYDPTGGDIEADVKTFLNLIPAQNPRLAQHLARAKTQRIGWTTFSPDIAFSLLYVPDRYDRAAIVAAFLPYYNVELRTTEFPDAERLKRKHGGHVPQVVQLVGGAGWNHPSLPIRGGEAVQGALFVDAYAGDLAGDTGAQLAQAFTARTGRAPSSAAAQVHDAALLVARARASAQAGRDVRAAFTSALARGKLDDGACGPAAMGVSGELERDPNILEVQGDQILVAP